MTAEIVLEDGTTETFARVKVDDGFVHCFEESESPDRDDFDAAWEYWTVILTRLMMFTFQSPYYHKKSIPESRIKELQV